MTKFRFLRKYLDDLLFGAGLIAILAGTIQEFPRAAWFVLGIECIVAGIVVALSRSKRK
jgi:uncharacterized membrane protein SirB2